MKLSKLHIDQYRHLENLDFDFTYPMDFHDETKRGKPLDKICFIGQSATGKTSLLDIIHDKYEKFIGIGLEQKQKIYSDIELFGFSDLKCIITFNTDDRELKIAFNKIIADGVEFKKSNEGGNFNRLTGYFEEENKLFYFKAGLISNNNLNIFNQHPSDLNEKFRDKLITSSFFKKQKINIFDDNVSDDRWLVLLEEYISYNKKFSQKMSELIHKGLIADTKKLEKEFKIWEKENPKTLSKFADLFNPILNNLNLEVDLINTEYPIPLKDKRTDSIIPIKDSSTGTKGLLLSFLPLFNTETKDSIVLIDEPERSLFPDIQMDLMDYYQNLAPEAQFIIATHSPFIAASFEPCERFILYFDEEGKVAVRQGTSPIGDDPNDLLSNDFKIDYINKFGHQKFQEYIDLKQKVYFEKDEKRKEEYLEKLEKLGDQYNF
ncbi:ATP-binding protein [Flavobacterium columnare]|uniref:Endonuclease GajA/Old nuclease/RecF-like AAA domain-containing protein n=1 Tax=Flavobacterium columnare TaxID=996 RepID=A0AAI8CJC7_9FLAO|nr:ATP-binding protein [Flavobacterium columnare]AMO21060.1 hypothetical protein UN65_12595 [Flavobacterium columnare]AUX19062.1 hypothetical protein AQ623_12830 [Flavobacterium columnare]QOG58139.1 AAA family ATPase [Flavobacterium columnare]QOG60862.1 AAA family ATPase [Flavobacterium columnare]QOG63582.1 AAA family ATPase [Flavobacterium columnare]